jgi:hypothetical protein
MLSEEIFDFYKHCHRFAFSVTNTMCGNCASYTVFRFLASTSWKPGTLTLTLMMPLSVTTSPESPHKKAE